MHSYPQGNVRDFYAQGSPQVIHILSTGLSTNTVLDVHSRVCLVDILWELIKRKPFTEEKIKVLCGKSHRARLWTTMTTKIL